MARGKATGAGWRGSREVWLGAAYEVLVASGVDDVRIQPLGKRLALSRTSFYWFFPDREALLEALLAQWREKNTGNLIGKASTFAESVTEAILNVFDCWLDPGLFESSFEHAVRSWALQSPQVAAEVRRADEARIRAIVDLFARFGFDPMAADVRARTVYLTQIGYISTGSDEALGLRMDRIPHYAEIFTGIRPESGDIARFHARHSSTVRRAKDDRHVSQAEMTPPAASA